MFCLYQDTFPHKLYILKVVRPQNYSRIFILLVTVRFYSADYIFVFFSSNIMISGHL